MREYMARVKEEAARQKALEMKEAKEIAQRENKLIAKQTTKEQLHREWSHKMMQKNRELCEYRHAQREADTAKLKEEDANLNRGTNHFMSRFGTSLQ